jgi:hypothetical protein
MPHAEDKTLLLVTISRERAEFARLEAGRLYGAKRGAVSRFWEHLIDKYREKPQ